MESDNTKNHCSEYRFYYRLNKVKEERKVFQSPLEFGSQELSGSLDPDLNPCERICAMMAGPGTNLEGGSRVTGTGQERCNCPAMNGNRYDDSRSLQNPCHSPTSLSFYLLASMRRQRNELRVRIVLRREK